MDAKDTGLNVLPAKNRQSLSGLFSRNSIWSVLSLLSSSKRASVFSKHTGEYAVPPADVDNAREGSGSSDLSSPLTNISPRKTQLDYDRGIKKSPTLEDFADTSDEDSEASRIRDPIAESVHETSLDQVRQMDSINPGAGKDSLHGAQISSQEARRDADEVGPFPSVVNVRQEHHSKLQGSQNQQAGQLQVVHSGLGLDSEQHKGVNVEENQNLHYEPYDSEAVLEHYLTVPYSSTVFENNSTFLEEFDESKSSVEGHSFLSAVPSAASPPPSQRSPASFPSIQRHSLTKTRNSGSPSFSSSSGSHISSPSVQSRHSAEVEEPVPIRKRPVSSHFRSFQIASIMEEDQDHPTPNSSIASMQLSPSRDHFNISSFNNSLVNHSSGSGGSGGSSSGGSRVRNAPTRVTSQPENRQTVNYDGMENATIVRTNSLTHARSVRHKPHLVSLLRHPSSGESPGQRESNASGSVDNSQSTGGDDISMSTGELLSQLNDAMGAAESETLMRTAGGLQGTYDRKSQGYSGLRSSIVSQPSRAYHVSSDFPSDPFQKKGYEVPTPLSRQASGSSSSFHSASKANVTLPITNVEILRDYEHQSGSLSSNAQLPPFTKEHSLSSEANSNFDLGRNRQAPLITSGPQIIPSAVVSDKLRKQNSHEDMMAPHDSSTNSYHDNFSDDFNDDLQDTIEGTSSDNIFDEKHIYDPRRYFNYYPWWYFLVLMILGLVVPPVYFLISCGVFDVNNRYKQFRLNYYFQQYSRHHRDKPRVVKFTRGQKWISFVFGLFWVTVILAMIGCGLGIVLTRDNP